MLREMSTRYGRTPGGYIWALLEPVGWIVIMAVAFSLLMRNPPLGSSFVLFFAAGFVAFDMYNQIQGNVGRALRFSKALLAYPAVTWLDAILARLILNVLTASMVAYILLTAILYITETRTVLDIRPMVEAMFMAALLGLGVGTLNCVLMGFYPIWDRIWGVVTRPLFIASGIIFLYDDMPPMAKEILWYNPLIHITGMMRTGFYPMYNPQYISKAYVIYVSLILLILGLILLRRYHRDILNQ